MQINTQGYAQQIAALILELKESSLIDKKGLLITLQDKIQTYIREEFIQQQLLTPEGQEMLADFGLDNEKNLAAYQAFLIDFYDPAAKQAVLRYTRPDGKEYPITLTFSGEKEFLLNDGAVQDARRLDELFSFRYTIDLQKSDAIFLSLLVNNNKNRVKLAADDPDELLVPDKTQWLCVYDKEEKKVLQ